MAKYRNVMERLVEEVYDQIAPTLQCCQCEQCRNDIIAYALNQLPSKYVATAQGEMYSKTYSLGVQHRANIMTALAQGANVVRANPRH